MAYEQIAFEPDGAVARITLNRPDKLNALTAVMSDELVDALGRVEREDGLRAVLLTGAGRGFCAGQDLTEFDEAYRKGERPDIREHLTRTYHRLIPAMTGLPKPIVCAVNGVAAGAGVSLALACDIRLAGASARFTQAFVKIGLIPDSGGTYLLPRAVGYAKALELSLTGDLLDAGTARDIGLVSQVVPDEDLTAEAGELAARLAAMPTRALGETKRLLQASLAPPLEEALAREAEAQARMSQTDDHLEGVMAFAEKREPRFRGG
ncbi:MAG TPA: enoyl-CoA hydratase-related protein [Actinomycetota bacterium]|nr:enoyl-CoA hydratase-related protein [Actinomycetota bacterium]